MKLKSFKTIQILYIVVSASSLLVACHTKVTEPLKLMSAQGVVVSQTTVSSDNATIVESYGVPSAQGVLFSSQAQEESQDLTY
jgi:uncharacterized protein YcfL